MQVLTDWAGYWAWLLGVAAGIYGLVVFAEKHLSPARREDLSLWLMGAYDDTWPRNFCILFDRVFGERHLSFHCFFRSALASVLGVLAIWLLLDGILGVLTVRAGTTLPLWQALALGAAINVLPDYLSLFQTRWMLQAFDRVRSPWLQLLVLIGDAILTGVIIWACIQFWLLLRGEATISLVEMAALFSIYAIFFWSTFLTSFFAWLFCVTSWFARLVARTALRDWLDIEGAPGRQIALIGSFLVIIAGLAVAPILRPGADGRARFDDFLCWAFPHVCPNVARLTSDQAAKFEYLAQACDGPISTQCLDAGLAELQMRDDEAADLFRKACAAGNGHGCTRLGWIEYSGRGTAQDDAAAAEHFRAGCDAGDPQGCNNLGGMYLDGRVGAAPDPERARELYQRACDAGSPHGCFNLAERIFNTAEDAGSKARAEGLYHFACDANLAAACLKLGSMYEIGDGVTKDLAEAAALYKRACNRANFFACRALGKMYRDGRGVTQDLTRAEQFFDQACELGFFSACFDRDSLRRRHDRND